MFVSFSFLEFPGNFQEESQRAKVKVISIFERNNSQRVTDYLLSASLLLCNRAKTFLETEIRVSLHISMCVCGVKSLRLWQASQVCHN